MKILNEIGIEKIKIMEEQVMGVFYEKGEKEILPRLILSGFVTSGTTNIFLTVPVPKKLKTSDDITVTKAYFEARGQNGYVNSQHGFHEYVGRTGYDISVVSQEGYTLVLRINNDTQYTNVSNNTLVMFHGDVEFTVN